MSVYIRYYDDQIGGGLGVRNFYTGSRYQRGNGVGSWLGGLLRKILPYVASGAKAVGKEALRAGARVVDDVTNNGVNLKEAFKTRARESRKTLRNKAADKLSEMMKGDGYKSRSRKRGRQSRKKRASGRTVSSKKRIVKKKVKKRKTTVGRKKKRASVRSIADIFGPR